MTDAPTIDDHNTPTTGSPPATSPTSSTTRRPPLRRPRQRSHRAAAFLTRKAELFTRIADQTARSRPDAYSEQVQQMATDTPTDHAEPQLPHQRVGPDHKRTPDHPPDADGAKSQEKTGASSG